MGSEILMRLHHKEEGTIAGRHAGIDVDIDVDIEQGEQDKDLLMWKPLRMSLTRAEQSST